MLRRVTGLNGSSTGKSNFSQPEKNSLPGDLVGEARRFLGDFLGVRDDINGGLLNNFFLTSSASDHATKKNTQLKQPRV